MIAILQAVGAIKFGMHPFLHPLLIAAWQDVQFGVCVEGGSQAMVANIGAYIKVTVMILNSFYNRGTGYLKQTSKKISVTIRRAPTLACRQL